MIEKGTDAGWSGTGPLPEFTPDGQFLVWESGEGRAAPLSTVTGREVARLESPDQGRCGYTTFSSDGRLLITTNKDYATLHVWDLHELRRRLKDMDLDWDAPSDPAVAQERPSRFGRPVEVHVDLGGMKGLAEKCRAAKDRNAEAWRLLTGPPGKWDPVQALKLSEQAVRDDPDMPIYTNTLGVAQYRNGRYRQAVATLEQSLAAGKGQYKRLRPVLPGDVPCEAR